MALDREVNMHWGQSRVGVALGATNLVCDVIAASIIISLGKASAMSFSALRRSMVRNLSFSQA